MVKLILSLAACLGNVSDFKSSDEILPLFKYHAHDLFQLVHPVARSQLVVIAFVLIELIVIVLMKERIRGLTWWVEK